ncbi:tripartite tricarboxylate transporter TctB family protein [Alteribacillus sp. YIM 98480]|uniref:tripartite tricarboxylate transporter TctB family protein n=1 Tax=Alteribacillus sp. YIM 98480 TaxID=2606599 RepID=UPI00131EB7B0|nr:tripartite tricarboxylate transporter TctB family protein [Alteribacillus sp. YIM 98480]
MMENNKTKMQLFHRLFLPALIFIFITIYFLEVQGLDDPRDRMLITPIYWVMAAFFPIILFQEWKNWKAAKPDKKEKEEEETESYEVDAPLSKKALSFMVSIFLYLFLIEHIGFVLITIIFLPTLMWLLGTKDWKLLVFLPIIVTGALYVLFVIWLEIPLPTGILL